MNTGFPNELIEEASALIGICGLDTEINEEHARIWKLFTQHRESSRTPMRFVSMNHSNFPPKKPNRTSYEWYVPKGILKTNWMKKHLFELPSILVIFSELNWNDYDWEDKKIKLTNTVKTSRNALQGRGTKIAVILIQKNSECTNLSDSERAASICSSCDLSARSLFVLPIQEDENLLLGYILRLEKAFYELYQNYYHGEIRVVKGHRDYLNKTTHLYLFVRHQFKIGFYYEMKKDINMAYKNYLQSYNLLLEVRTSDTNLMEVKTVAGFINYKICKLAFSLHQIREAISHFKKHMDFFQSKSGGGSSILFEHSAWLSSQCSFFAHLFVTGVSVETHKGIHPGIYYHAAATYAIARRVQIQKIKGSESFEREFEEYKRNKEVLGYSNDKTNDDWESLEFYGQRPWRAGKAALEPPNKKLETEGMKALIFRECEFKHSDSIISLLQMSIRQYVLYNRPRMKARLLGQIVEEMELVGNYEEALTILQEVIQFYDSEGWSLILTSLLNLGLKLSLLSASISGVVYYSCELGRISKMYHPSFVTNNISRILSGQIPEAPENLSFPSLAWEKNLNCSHRVETRNLFFLSVDAQSKESTQGIEIILTLQNKISADFSIPIHSVGIKFENQNELLVHPSIRDFELISSESKSLIFELTPNSYEHNSSVIRIDKILIVLGHSHVRLMNTEKRDCFLVPIKEYTPSFEMNISHPSGPLLIGESFPVKVSINESKAYSSSYLVKVVNFQSCKSTQELCKLSLAPGGDSKSPLLLSLTHSLSSMFCIQSFSPGPHSFQLSLISSERNGEERELCNKSLTFESIYPFRFRSELLTISHSPTHLIYTEEPFLIYSEIESNSPSSLLITDSFLNSLHPSVVLEKNEFCFRNSSLTQNSILSDVFCLKVSCNNLGVGLDSMETEIDLGNYSIKWSRRNDNGGSDFEVISSFCIPKFKLRLNSSLYAQLEMPSFALLRTPIFIVYKLWNPSNCVHEYELTMEASEAFMMSGNKLSKIQIIPRSSISLTYILYPLTPGTVPLPKLKLTSLRLTMSQDVDDILNRLLPKTIMVFPGSGHSLANIKSSSSVEYLQKSQPHALSRIVHHSSDVLKYVK